MDDLEKSLLSDTKPVCPETQPMGLGKLGDQSIVFVRKFRWTLAGANLDEHYVKNIKFDFVGKKLEIEAYEIVADNEINIHTWLESDLSKERLVFTTYDGCGTPLYSYVMSGIKLLSDTASFDYSSSAESTRLISVAYHEIRREFHLESKKPAIVKKRFDWRISIDNTTPVPVKVHARPKLHIEETEINFLNAKMWIPGKSQWEHISLELENNYKHLISMLLVKQHASKNVFLYLHDLNGDLLETWELEDASLIRMLTTDEKTEFTLSYDNVTYKSEVESCPAK